MDQEVAVAHERACDNCTTELSGKFCHKCGQKELHHHAWSLSHFLHDAWHEVAHLDSKIFRTLKLLVFRPGEMTRMYLDGHRQPFVNPVRLYLAMTALFFFFGGQTDFNVEGFQRSGNAGGLTEFVEAVAKKKGVPYAVELKDFNQGFHKKFSIFIALGVLMYGLTVHWAYRQREIWYSRSLIFAVHFFSLFFLWLLVWRLALHYLGNAGIRVPMQLFFVLSLLLLAISLRHVWPEKASRFVPKVLFLWFSSIVIYSAAVGVAIGLQILLYGRMAQLAYRN